MGSRNICSIFLSRVQLPNYKDTVYDDIMNLLDHLARAPESQVRTKQYTILIGRHYVIKHYMSAGKNTGEYFTLDTYLNLSNRQWSPEINASFVKCIIFSIKTGKFNVKLLINRESSLRDTNLMINLSQNLSGTSCILLLELVQICHHVDDLLIYVNSVNAFDEYLFTCQQNKNVLPHTHTSIEKNAFVKKLKAFYPKSVGGKNKKFLKVRARKHKY